MNVALKETVLKMCNQLHSTLLTQLCHCHVRLIAFHNTLTSANWQSASVQGYIHTYSAPGRSVGIRVQWCGTMLSSIPQYPDVLERTTFRLSVTDLLGHRQCHLPMYFHTRRQAHIGLHLTSSHTSWRPCTHNPRLLHTHAPDAHLAWVQHLTASSAVLSPTPPFKNRLPHSTNKIPHQVIGTQSNAPPPAARHSPSQLPHAAAAKLGGVSPATVTAHGGSHSTSSTASW